MPATVFILPTTGPRTYRGKYPSRARSLSSGATGYHIELLDGTRLWSMSPIADDDGKTGSGLKALYSGAQMNAREMTQAEYAELTRAAEMLRGMIGIAGHGRRDRLARDVRALCLAIVAPYAETISTDATAQETAPASPAVKTIDLTPTWSGMLGTLRMLIENGDATGRKMAWEEMARMAALADARNTLATALGNLTTAANETAHCVPAGMAREELDGAIAAGFAALAGKA